MNLATLSNEEKQSLIDAFYWYQTIQFSDGLKSRGTVDHAEAFAKYGFPSVAGRTVLDVGASEGYFAFAFERLGAQKVVAVDVDRWIGEPGFDLPARTKARRLRKFQPLAGEEEAFRTREELARRLGFDRPNPFYLARAMLRSNVDFRSLSIYDLPLLSEQFDLVFVGTVTTHLQDLVAAFEAVRAVTRMQAIIACADLLDFDALAGWRWLAFQAIRALRVMGSLKDQVAIPRESPVALYTANASGSIWRPSVECIQELLLSAGFKDAAVYSRFALKNLRHGTLMNHVVFHAFV
ncbi:MAG: methyltransferase domain-containing protein [Candidatus Omnitrophica bacterium]|nr:methyltransferase domain-containing protein [Candidatus Omnitrophota bacterium]